MANGNPINNLEHDNLSPVDYSNGIERKYYNALPQSQVTTMRDQTYLRTYYDQFEYRNYAGDVFIMPPYPIYLPKINVYNGIAPMQLQPSIDPLYPWESFYQ